MFRITKAFENEKTAIYKVEGRILEDLAEVWVDQLEELQDNGRQIILDMGQVWYLSQKGIEVFVQKRFPNFYLLNCSMEVRNTLQAAGCAATVLG
jgi:anti-anti-sigma regulatory factor